MTKSDSDIRAKEVKDDLDLLFVNELCPKIKEGIQEYVVLLTEYFKSEAIEYFECHRTKRKYKLELHFWGGLANTLFRFFEFQKLLQDELDDVWNELIDHESVKVKVKYNDGECIVKCTFKVKSV